MRRCAAAAVAGLTVAGALLLVGGGCGNDETGWNPPDGTSSHGGQGGAGVGGSLGTGGSAVGGSGGVGGESAGPTRQTLVGDATWTVTFDAEALAAGATNCEYTRHYVGVEDRSAPWLCPACEVLFRAEVEVTTGGDDCYPQVSEYPPATLEWVGYAGGAWWRANASLATEQGTAVVSEGSVTIANSVADLEAPMGGTLGFDVAGSFALGQEQGDPMHGWQAAGSYACGWPKAAPAPYDGNYLLTVGATVPDGLFLDSCGDIVRLHDFRGIYLIFDMAAVDCPACNSMAAAQEQFITDMAAEGITVHVITMLAPSLGDPLGETTPTMLTSWETEHGLSSPVLADRGWGLSMFVPLYEADTAYPSWVIVDPELRVLEHGAGFDTFDEHAAIIRADAP